MSIAAHTPISPAPVAPHRQVARVAVRVDLAGQNPDSRTLELLETLRRLLQPGADTATDPARHALPSTSVSAIHIHPEIRTVLRGTTEIALTRLEFDLLLFSTRRRRGHDLPAQQPGGEPRHGQRGRHRRGNPERGGQSRGRLSQPAAPHQPAR